MERFEKGYPKNLAMDNDLYKIIDTASFYKIILKDKKDYFLDRRLDTIRYDSVLQGFKFYKEGRVGYFANLDFRDKDSFNPQRAYMGYYGYNHNDIYVELLLTHPQAGFFRSRFRMTVVGSDTITLYSLATTPGGGYLLTLERQSIPAKLLIYKTDW